MSIISGMGMQYQGSIYANMAEETVRQIDFQIIEAMKELADVKKYRKVAYADSKSYAKKVDFFEKTLEKVNNGSLQLKSAEIARMQEVVTNFKDAQNRKEQLTAELRVEIDTIHERLAVLEQEKVLAKNQIEMGNNIFKEGKQMAKGAMQRMFA